MTWYSAIALGLLSDCARCAASGALNREYGGCLLRQPPETTSRDYVDLSASFPSSRFPGAARSALSTGAESSQVSVSMPHNLPTGRALPPERRRLRIFP